MRWDCVQTFSQCNLRRKTENTTKRQRQSSKYSNIQHASAPSTLPIGDSTVTELCEVNQVSCPGCGAQDFETLICMGNMPVFCNVLLASRSQACSVATGQLKLVHCRSCNLVFNRSFDPSLVKYASGYENSLHHSPCFQDYADQSVQALVDRLELRSGFVVDIGCGQGEFLKELCVRAGARGLGFDPSYDPGRGPDLPDSVTIQRELFCSQSMESRPDLICCRHVLEHLHQPSEFLSQIVEEFTGGDERIAVFFEVPNAIWVLEKGSIWDVLYEHHTYYTPLSLQRVFRQAGFEALDVRQTYGGQYLTMTAEIPLRSHISLPPVAEQGIVDVNRYSNFGEECERIMSDWRNLVLERVSCGKSIVVWGAGSKGVMFLNLLNASTDEIGHIVDLNPAKHGCFVPGTGQKVVAPVELTELQPDIIIVMNPLYVDEIREMTNELGVEAELLLACGIETSTQTRKRYTF